MTIQQIIRESEAEHAEPCRVGEWRECKLTETENGAYGPSYVEHTKLRGGWIVFIVRSEKDLHPYLRYTKTP